MESNSKKISGNIVDVLNSKIYQGTIKISSDRIIDIVPEDVEEKTYIIPGFIDSHVHIESSMLPPSEFSRAAAIHGTVAVLSDPHEIANVLGVDGVNYMIEDAKSAPIKFCFGAPSCVPASPFEASGAVLGPDEIEELLSSEEIRFLGEVMNFPGVIEGDPGLSQKLEIAKKYSKVIDGHAPGLTGKNLATYVSAGISTDHECLTKEEALEKIKLGMKIQIREGSAAKIAKELIPLLEEYYENCMFCCDDKHPDDLVRGHINDLVKMALKSGIDRIKVLRAASVNPIFHYGLDVGLLRRGDYADFVIVDNLNDLNILGTYINGNMVAKKGQTLISRTRSKVLNNFVAEKKEPKDFVVNYRERNINVIKAMDGQLVTDRLILVPRIKNKCVVSDPERDILKIAVINRYGSERVGIGFIKGFGLKKGAIASSIAHDSHNIIAVGVSNEEICRAINLIINEKGGISTVSEANEMILPLPLAGIMSDGDYLDVANKYADLDKTAKSFGSPLHSPFMTLSFMALLVIPKLKLSDRGLFDGERFQFLGLFETPSGE